MQAQHEDIILTAYINSEIIPIENQNYDSHNAIVSQDTGETRHNYEITIYNSDKKAVETAHVLNDQYGLTIYYGNDLYEQVVLHCHNSLLREIQANNASFKYTK